MEVNATYSQELNKRSGGLKFEARDGSFMALHVNITKVSTGLENDNDY